ncbi:post-GPI attachment to proteins factor 2-like isoform X1 [Anopheles bellator]|uniref:post-GPI attachment to proteins factor 2-like isoform X1 n=1 Tax=Anopheles bellator TaxID=139047 RepID=UPI00264A3F98|nr:post-GPI attachment to proteins factor 2-like isoform X1 [Anopheles bellator]XP_058064176.1 post-GPI attachment to proteins factor 2-like isoform X1 [Anopheles bellator]
METIQDGPDERWTITRVQSGDGGNRKEDGPEQEDEGRTVAPSGAQHNQPQHQHYYHHHPHRPQQQQQQQQLVEHVVHHHPANATQRKSRTNERSKDRTSGTPNQPDAASADSLVDDAVGSGGGSSDNDRRHRKSHPEKLVVHLIIGFRDMCVFTLVLPLGTLFVCFVSAYVFQPEEIHETHCRVYNIIPSISAITGVSPQRYLWRISIALHIGPRFIIAFVYRNWYRAMLANIEEPTRRKKVRRMINVVYCLNLLEISALCGVTYISNKENYPLHEKVFIIFMVTSLTYMLVTLKLLRLLQPDGPQTPHEESSLRYKQAFFALSIASTVGLILFFLKHRFFCQDLAFSWFALCEYIVASANMGFHCTTMLDFPTEDLLIARNAKQYKKPYTRIGWKLD